MTSGGVSRRPGPNRETAGDFTYVTPNFNYIEALGGLVRGETRPVREDELHDPSGHATFLDRIMTGVPPALDPAIEEHDFFLSGGIEDDTKHLFVHERPDLSALDLHYLANLERTESAGHAEQPQARPARRASPAAPAPLSGEFHEKSVTDLMLDGALDEEDHSAYLIELNAWLDAAKPANVSRPPLPGLRDDDPRKPIMRCHIRSLFALDKMLKTGLIGQEKFEASLEVAGRVLCLNLRPSFGDFLLPDEEAHGHHLLAMAETLHAKEQAEATLDGLVARQLIPAEDAERFKGVVVAWAKNAEYFGPIEFESDLQQEEIAEQNHLMESLDRAASALTGLQTLEDLDSNGVVRLGQTDLASRLEAALNPEAIERGFPEGSGLVIEACGKLTDVARIGEIALEVSQGVGREQLDAAVRNLTLSSSSLIQAGVGDFKGYVAFCKEIAAQLEKVWAAAEIAFEQAQRVSPHEQKTEDLYFMLRKLHAYIGGVSVLEKMEPYLAVDHWERLSKSLDEFLALGCAGLTGPESHNPVLNQLAGYQSFLDEQAAAGRSMEG